ncbi:MAG: 2-C-methyl-D-erythritol 2,4-cyclodiphosphate synthase [Clostridiales Family XIII bacterium]|jgi:2-C-methyl-D-erythritol 2,4-cyclodiphosphate synthase/2-C-methyl-D-erythritol 4-phosphate cytidylyltransferase|nr:2-C-methyl-D-erythritol 2,4-cyclodiphosphate synthase [Clostridiales Family XIII bacterium]
MYKGKNLTVIIAAGGAGTRFGADAPKQFLDVGGQSMLAAAARPFVRLGYADELVFAVPDGFIEQTRKLMADELGAIWAGGQGGMQILHAEAAGRHIKLRAICGGEDRAASVRAGLEAASVREGLVLIHDAARPFVSEALIERVLEAANACGAAVPAVPIRDTVYIAGADSYASEIPDRAKLRAVQTPQGFDFALISAAHERALQDGIFVTDDGMPVLAAGGRVSLVDGDLANIKITRADDLPEAGLRVGAGFDAHRFAEGRPLILGGVEIPFEKGLAGHSDADVLTHALMDAILGALCEGDIGKLFPDADPAYEGVSSLKLLGEVTALMRARGYGLGNADLTLVCERPRMAPYREEVTQKLAAALGTAPENVSLKATTTEKLGFAGREEGIAAEAVVLLKRKYTGKDGMAK